MSCYHRIPKSEIQCKGVISGVPLDVGEDEIVACCDGGFEAKRLKSRRSGKLEDTMSVCVTFGQKYLPGEVKLGFQMFEVRPYVPYGVLRCLNVKGLAILLISVRDQPGVL